MNAGRTLDTRESKTTAINKKYSYNTKLICQKQLSNSLVAYGLANLLECRDVKVLGTCLFQTGTLKAQITQNGRGP